MLIDGMISPQLLFEIVLNATTNHDTRDLDQGQFIRQRHNPHDLQERCIISDNDILYEV